jgi:Ni/Fe-hydrogenase subunit HybB-like protein
MARETFDRRILTTPFMLLLSLGILAIALIGWRFAAGLGATTNLNSGFPWGIWIAFDVVTGTALACGGYAMALLVYVFNRGRYHPLVRPAILTSALGYTLAGISIMIDVGRPWYLWKVPVMLWKWNVNSVLLEVAVCMMAYTFVLWIELTPVLLRRWKKSDRQGLVRFAERALPWFEKSLVWIVALGILLPTMHQSSLGSLMLLGGGKLHPLWNTMLLPPFFLLTCLAMGYAMVVFESIFSSRTFGRPIELRILMPLQKFAAYASLTFVGFRFLDLATRGKLGLVVATDLPAILFWIETILFLVPLAFLIMRADRPDPSGMLREAMIIALAGSLYRFDVFLLAFNPGAGWRYFPSVTETMITVGLVSLELAAYVALVKTFPILGGVKEAKGSRPPVPVTVAPTPSPAH